MGWKGRAVGWDGAGGQIVRGCERERRQGWGLESGMWAGQWCQKEQKGTQREEVGSEENGSWIVGHESGGVDGVS